MSDDFLARVQRDGSNSLDQEAAEIIQGLLEERARLRRQLDTAREALREIKNGCTGRVETTSIPALIARRTLAVLDEEDKT